MALQNQTKMNKVILIGGDHHNGLGLARSFGLNGIEPFGLIISSNNKSFIAKSKYWNKTWIFKNDSEAVEFLLSNFSEEEEKPVIIPWSDSAAAEIDINLNKLLPDFIVPSLGGRQGEIVKMMDKQNQIDFLKKYNLPMASSWTVILPYKGNASEFIFPCICKPVSSYEGAKMDIRKCDNANDLIQYFNNLTNKGYTRILVQEYIFFDLELEFVGSLDSNPSYIISQNTRSWPVIGGTNSFFQIINKKEINDVCMLLLTALKEEKYFGQFDIELFKVGNRVLINEINWRNTGNSFFSLGTGVHWAVCWYKNAIGEDTSQMKHTTTDEMQYAMNEATDLRHVIFGKLSFKTWLKEFKETQSYALWFRKDLKPTLYRYIYLAKELLLHRRNG